MEKEKEEKILALMPVNPGVYLMKNKTGEIIYIGKSRSLKKRISSYFNRNHSNVKTSVMVSLIEDIEFIITGSETEALILENNLIKKHMPRYNILLKDSKTHPYIKVTISEPYPRLEKVRKVRFRDGNQYFGPFPNAYDLSRIVDLLSRNFRLCTMRRKVIPKTNARPCLKYHLGICQGICMGEIAIDEYAVSINKALDMLSGRSQPDFTGLKNQLKECVSKYRYEEAAEIRDTITALVRFFSEQKVEFLKSVNLDFWGNSQAGDCVVFSVIFVRAGKMVGNRVIKLVNDTGISIADMLRSVVSTFYDSNLIPSTIYCSIRPHSLEALLEMLFQRSGRKVEIHQPKKGQFLKLLNMANDNAGEVMRNIKAKDNQRISEAVIDLQNRLQLAITPVRIECVDISHIQGVDPVASLVVFDNGLPKKSEYRLFHIKSATGGDDPASIGEVTRRRFTRLLREQATLPDLYIVDGGITQVKSACYQLDELGVKIAVMGLAKREEILVAFDGTEIKLPFSSSGMKMIIKLRNEAHRFANSFQRKTHSSRMVKSSLLNLPGVGMETLKKILAEFGSTAKAAKATPEELQTRCKIPIKIAKLVIESLKSQRK